jgi:hypothetical protein
MSSRIGESTQRPLMTPSIFCGNTLGTVFSPIATLIWLNVTVAGTVTFHTLDGSSVTQAFPVGFFILDIQCDTVTLGTATAMFTALANPV